MNMQLQPYNPQPPVIQQGGLQGLSQVVQAIQQQLASVSGTIYVPPLSSVPYLAYEYFKWYKLYGIAYYEDGTKKPTITPDDVEYCRNKMKENLDVLPFGLKVKLLREGYLSFSY
jgi:hypothetical protein